MKVPEFTHRRILSEVHLSLSVSRHQDAAHSCHPNRLLPCKKVTVEPSAETIHSVLDDA